MKGGALQRRVVCLAILALVGAYLLLQPTLECRFGVTLPTILRNSDRGVAEPEKPALPPAPEPARPPAPATPDGPAETVQTPLGQLTDVGGGSKRSTAGLHYTPGSAEGHRLQHVLRHGRDLPDRPGLHGVFDGGQETLLAVIDEAYLLARRGGSRVKVEREGARTVYEVDLGRRIGFVGGQVGKRRGHPPASHVRLILEGDRVISAFPF